MKSLGHLYLRFCISLLLLVMLSAVSSGERDLEDSEGPLMRGLEDIRISEIMYHPLDAGLVNGDSLEFIELKNTGSTAVDLGGVSFSEGISFVFASGTMLQAGGFVVLASNASEFQSFYGFAPTGDYNGRLDNGGEQITLSDAGGNPLISFRYDDRIPWPLGPDGAGFSLVPVDESAGLDLSDPASWRGSSFGGSPGADEPAIATLAPIQINEVLTHTDLPFKDAVELFNPTNDAVNLGGWYLSDLKESPRKYRIPDNTSIPAQGYLVFDEDDFNPTPGTDPSFALSSFGDAIYLFSADAQDNLTGYVRGFSFGGAANGISFGRAEWAGGEEELLPQLSETLGRENSGPRIGPVVISEIFYGPPVGQDEFLELVNISSQTIPLYDQQFPENTWRIEGIDFAFPMNAELGPGEIALVVPVPPELFRAARGVPAHVAIFGPYAGRLNNAGEVIQLQAPEDPDLDGTVPFYNIDAVEYSDNAPWPAAADGGGASLYKTNLDGISNDPSVWQALANSGTPGFVDLGSVSNEQPASIEASLHVSPAWPNPFESSTTIQFSSNQTERVQVKLYDVLGREVRLLFDGVAVAGTTQDVRIPRADLPAGTYFIQVIGERRTVIPVTAK